MDWRQACDRALLCYPSLAYDRYQHYQHAHVDRYDSYHLLQPRRVLFRSERRSARFVPSPLPRKTVLTRLPPTVDASSNWISLGFSSFALEVRLASTGETIASGRTAPFSVPGRQRTDYIVRPSRRCLERFPH